MKKKKTRKYAEGGTAGGTMQVRTRLNTMPRVDEIPEPPSGFFGGGMLDLLNPFTSPFAPHNMMGGGMMGGGMMMENGGEASRAEKEKRYYELREQHKELRGAIGSNDKELLLKLQKEHGHNNNLSALFNEAMDLKNELYGWGFDRHELINFPHVGQQIKGVFTSAYDEISDSLSKDKEDTSNGIHSKPRHYAYGGGIPGPHNMLLGMMGMGQGYGQGQDRDFQRTMEEISRLDYNDSLQQADSDRTSGIPFFGYGDRKTHIAEGARGDTDPFQDLENMRAHTYRHVIPRNNSGNMGMLGGMMGMPMPFANGGEVPDEYLTGASSDSDITVPGPSPVDINIESKEFVETPEGEGFKVPGNVSHENTSLREEGGINMTLPENSFIYPKGKWAKRKEGREKQAQKLYKELEGGNKSEGLLRDDYKKNSILQKLKNLQLEDESDRYEITEIKKAKEEEGANQKGFADGAEVTDPYGYGGTDAESMDALYKEAISLTANQSGYSADEIKRGKAAKEFVAAFNQVFDAKGYTVEARLPEGEERDHIVLVDTDLRGKNNKKGGYNLVGRKMPLPINKDGIIPGKLKNKISGFFSEGPFGETPPLASWDKSKKAFQNVTKNIKHAGLSNDDLNLLAGYRIQQAKQKNGGRDISNAHKEMIFRSVYTHETGATLQRRHLIDNLLRNSKDGTGARFTTPGELGDVSDGHTDLIDMTEKDYDRVMPGFLGDEIVSPGKFSDVDGDGVPDEILAPPTDGGSGGSGDGSAHVHDGGSGGSGGTDGTTVEEEDPFKVTGFGKDDANVDDLVSKIGAEGKEKADKFDTSNYLEGAKRIGADYINNQSQLLQMMFPGGPERDYPNYWQGIQNKSLADLDKMSDIVDQENKIAKKDANIDFATMKDLAADYNPQRQSSKFAGLFNAKRNQDRKQFLETLNKKAEILGKKADYNFKGETLTRTGADKALELEDSWRAAYGQAHGSLNNFMYQDAASNWKTAKDMEMEQIKWNLANNAFGFQSDTQGDITMKKNKPMETVKNGGLIRRKYKRGSVVKRMYDNRSSNPSPNSTSDRDPYFWGAIAQAAIPLIGSLLGGGKDKKEDDGGGGGGLGGILGKIPIIGDLLGGIMQDGGHTQRYEGGGPSMPNLGGGAGAALGGGGGFPSPPGFGGSGGGGFPMPPGIGGGGGFPMPPGFTSGPFGRPMPPGMGGGFPMPPGFRGGQGDVSQIPGPFGFGSGRSPGGGFPMPPGMGGQGPGMEGFNPMKFLDPLGILGGDGGGGLLGGLFRDGGMANGRRSYGPGTFVSPPEAPTVSPPDAPTTGGGSGMDWGNLLQGLIGFDPMAQQMPDPDVIPKPTPPGEGATQEEWENYYKLFAMWQKMSKKPEQQGPGGLLGTILGGKGRGQGPRQGNRGGFNPMDPLGLMGGMGQQGMYPGNIGSGMALRDQQRAYQMKNTRNPYFQ
jgi:hypothetical protein